MYRSGRPRFLKTQAFAASTGATLALAAVMAADPIHAAQASPVHVIFESDKPSSPLYMLDYASLSDFAAGRYASQEALPLGVDTSIYSPGGLTADANGGYHLIFQSNKPSTPLYMLDYASLNDLRAGTYATQEALPLGVDTNIYSAGGLAADADGGYHLIFQSNKPSTPLYMLDYANLSDFTAGRYATQEALPLGVDTDTYSAGGLAADANGGYHLIFQSDKPSTPLYMLDYASLSDFAAGRYASQEALPLGVDTDTYSAGGIAIDFDTPIAAAVPEPSTWAVLILGFAMIGSAIRRNRKVSIQVASLDA